MIHHTSSAVVIDCHRLIKPFYWLLSIILRFILIPITVCQSLY